MSQGIHVMQKGDRWVVMRGNYTLDEFANQQQAVQLAKQRAKTSRADLILHAEDGSVRMVEDYQNSPIPSKRNKVRRTA